MLTSIFLVFFNNAFNDTLIEGLRGNGNKILHSKFFDTLKIRPKNVDEVKQKCERQLINLRYYSDGCVGIAVDETTGPENIANLLDAFGIQTSSVRRHSIMRKSVTINISYFIGEVGSKRVFMIIDGYCCFLINN